MTKALQVSRTAVVSTLAPTPEAYAPVQAMKPGAKGPAVSRLQTALTQLGFDPGNVSGEFGAKTEKALKAFQTAHGVGDHGIYGPKTEAALSKALRAHAKSTGPGLSVGMRGESVKTLQKELKERGLYDGAITGKFDVETRRALQTLEKKQGWKENGVAGRREWKELGGAPAGSGPKLRVGNEGLSVVALQKRLSTLGFYEGKADGKFGAATERAVKAFEVKAGLKSDGVVGAAMWNRLGVHVVIKDQMGGPTLRQGQQGRAVRILEQKLKDKGILKGKVDGTFDAATKRAVSTFERRQGVKADGVVGNSLWTKLGGAGAGSGPRLEVGASGAEVKVLQRRLAAKGHYDGAIDGDFGPQTQAAVRAFEKKSGLKTDGSVGPEVWRALGTHVVRNPQPKAALMPEPAHNYRRVQVDGQWINVRTQQMMKRAESFAKAMGVAVPFTVVQGSYSSGVAASGGTHDGGGAIDLRSWNRSRSDVTKIVKALRMAGFAAWKRGYGADSFDMHIHAIAIGDRQITAAARNQVAEYFRGGDGLVGSVPDGDANIGRPFPKWAEKYR